MKKRKENLYQFQTIFDPNGGGYTVTVPQLPGLVTEGDTLAEAREMAKDAIRCYVQGILKDSSNISRTAMLKRHVVRVAI